jgi:hypothetical protein
MAEERKVPTKEQWATIVENLSGMYGSVKLLVDGYTVDIQRGLTGKNTIGNIVYVNGHIDGKWMVTHKLSDTTAVLPDETKRFYRPSMRAIFKQKVVKRAEREYGKRFAKKDGYYEKLVFYSPSWGSANSLKRHFLKNNHNIELVKE